MPIQIRARRDTAANWTTANPILAAGEPGYETDTGRVKFGNGITAWTGLKYLVTETQTSTANMLFVVDEDDMATNSSTKVPTQQSVKQFVLAQVAATGTYVAVAHYITGTGWPSRPVADIVFWISEDPEAVTPGAAVGDDIVIMPTAVTTPPSTTKTTTTYTLDGSDDGTTIVFTNAGAVTVTVPTDGSSDLRDGFRVSLFAAGAGGVTLGLSGITVLGASPYTAIAQNQIIRLEKTATANTWIITGGTVAGAPPWGGLTYTYEEGTDATAVNVGNGVIATSTSHPTYSTPAAFHGALGFRCLGQQALFYAAPAADFSGSFYMQPVVNGASSSNRVLAIQSAADAELCALRLSNTGAIALVNAANAASVTATTTWAVNDLFRFDWQADYNDAADTLTLSVRIFKGANVNGTTPTETISFVFTTITVAPAKFRFGNYNTGTWDFYFDSLRIIGSLEWIGPW